MTGARQAVELAVLLLAIVVLAIATYGLNDPTFRVFLGVVIVTVIMAVTVRLAKVEVRSEPQDVVTRGQRYRRRRYLRLRNTLERFIDEVRLLNRIAVDAQRGFRSRDSAELEMRRIESRLESMIKQFRVAALTESEST